MNTIMFEPIWSLINARVISGMNIIIAKAPLGNFFVMLALFLFQNKNHELKDE